MSLTERPILFSAPMMRALLAGQKTQTRRVMKPQPTEGWKPYSYGEVHRMILGEPDPDKVIGWGPCDADGHEAYACPYGQPGDQLWVRETWAAPWGLDYKLPGGESGIFYRADDDTKYETDGPWRPSIHMPRSASRLTLEIISVRVDRVQEISEADAIAEGVEVFEDGCGFTVPGHGWKRSPEEAFEDLWNSINAARGFGWDANPFVWVVEFRRIDGKEAE